MVEHVITLNDDQLNLCRDFSKKTAQTQREHRSGGYQLRSIRTIELDTLRGKIGEYIVKIFLENSPFNISEIRLDFNVYPRGEWDDNDFSINDLNFSVKSAKWFSKWLLLETKDIIRGDLYDVYVFVVVNEDFRSGRVMGFATKEDILHDDNTLKLKKGELIPYTRTHLDADNHARHFQYLKNSLEEWQKLLAF